MSEQDDFETVRKGHAEDCTALGWMGVGTPADEPRSKAEFCSCGHEAALQRIEARIKELEAERDECRAAWKRMREMPSAVPIEIADLRAEVERLQEVERSFTELLEAATHDVNARIKELENETRKEGDSEPAAPTGRAKA